MGCAKTKVMTDDEFLLTEGARTLQDSGTN